MTDEPQHMRELFAYFSRIDAPRRGTPQSEPVLIHTGLLMWATEDELGLPH